MTLLQTTLSAPTKCGVFTSKLQSLTKIWALSPKTFLGGSHAQQTQIQFQTYYERMPLVVPEYHLVSGSPSASIYDQ